MHPRWNLRSPVSYKKVTHSDSTRCISRYRRRLHDKKILQTYGKRTNCPFVFSSDELIDRSPLKGALVLHCSRWISGFRPVPILNYRGATVSSRETFCFLSGAHLKIVLQNPFLWRYTAFSFRLELNFLFGPFPIIPVSKDLFVDFQSTVWWNSQQTRDNPYSFIPTSELW